MKNQQFDFTIDSLVSLLWQYNKAPTLQAILQSKADWYDENHTQFWEDWITDVFTLDTANDFGCSVWAIILGFPITLLQGPTENPKLNFGFGPYDANFDRSNFGTTSQTQIPMTTDQKRLVLKMRYFQLVTRGCVPQVNAFFKQLFAQYGPAYMLDNLDMTVTFVFDFVMPASLAFVFANFDLFPRPSGVAATYTSL